MLKNLYFVIRPVLLRYSFKFRKWIFFIVPLGHFIKIFLFLFPFVEPWCIHIIFKFELHERCSLPSLNLMPLFSFHLRRWLLPSSYLSRSLLKSQQSKQTEINHFLGVWREVGEKKKEPTHIEEGTLPRASWALCISNFIPKLSIIFLTEKEPEALTLGCVWSPRARSLQSSN